MHARIATQSAEASAKQQVEEVESNAKASIEAAELKARLAWQCGAATMAYWASLYLQGVQTTSVSSRAQAGRSHAPAADQLTTCTPTNTQQHRLPSLQSLQRTVTWRQRTQRARLRRWLRRR